MAIHYLSDIIHVTCLSPSGRRRSFMSDIAYNSGETLRDFTTKRKHHREHKDGTQIIASDIVSYLPCPFSDPNFGDTATRREQMYNSLYQLNESNKERVYWKTVVSLSNELNDEQIKIISERIAMSFSKKFHRPFDYSVHKKPKTKKKPLNIHIHFASPERTYENGWGEKSKSYYINLDGTLNTEKKYKDENGNDVRKPRTINDEEPVWGTDEKGHKICLNQQIVAGRKKWKMTDINKLRPKDLEWMHDEVDRIQNEVLLKKGLDPVHRNHKKTTELLKEAGIKAVHIGPYDYETQGKTYYDKIRQNENYERIASALNEKYNEIDRAEKEVSAKTKEEEVLAIKKQKAEQNLKTSRTNYANAIIDYVENELKPEEKFVDAAVAEFNQINNLATQNLNNVIRVLNNNISTANYLEKLNSHPLATDRELLLADYIKVNKHHLQNFNSTARTIITKNRNLTNRMRTVAKNLWRRAPGWHKRNYIAKAVGSNAGMLYEEYLRMKGQLQDINDGKSIEIPTAEQAVKSVLYGKSVPQLKTRIDTKTSATDNATRLTNAEIQTWQNEKTVPEPPTNVEVLTLWSNAPQRMIQLANDDNLSVKTPLKDYYPEKDKVRYETELHQMDQETFASLKQVNELDAANEKLLTITHLAEQMNELVAQEQKAEEKPALTPEQAQAEYERLSNIRNKALEKLQKYAIEEHAEKLYREALIKYNKALELQIPKDEKEEFERIKKFELSLSNPDFDRIDKFEQIYLDACETRKKLYPAPPVPDKEQIKKSLEKTFYRRYDLFRKKCDERGIELPQELINDYDNKAKAAQAVRIYLPKTDGAGKDKNNEKNVSRENNQQKNKPAKRSKLVHTDR